MTPLYEVVTEDPKETEAIGEAFGRFLEPGDFVGLEGDLGAGKTVFTRGVAAGLGCDPGEVQSPTFTLVREHSGRVVLYHLDLYRLEEPEEDLPAIGYEAFFEPEDGVAVVEWAQRAGVLLPRRRFHVRLEKDEKGRRIAIFAVGVPEGRLRTLRDQLAKVATGASRGTEGNGSA